MKDLLERIKAKEVFVSQKSKLESVLKSLRSSQDMLVEVNVGTKLLVKRSVLIYVLDFILEDYENIVEEYQFETGIFKQMVERLLKEEKYEKEVK